MAVNSILLFDFSAWLLVRSVCPPSPLLSKINDSSSISRRRRGESSSSDRASLEEDYHLKFYISHFSHACQFRAPLLPHWCIESFCVCSCICLWFSCVCLFCFLVGVLSRGEGVFFKELETVTLLTSLVYIFHTIKPSYCRLIS